MKSKKQDYQQNFEAMQNQKFEKFIPGRDEFEQEFKQIARDYKG